MRYQKLQHKRENIVALVLQGNSFIPKIIKLNINRLPDGVEHIDTGKGEWKLKQDNTAPITIEFGDASFNHVDTFTYPIIGFYDQSDITHQNALAQDYCSLMCEF